MLARLGLTRAFFLNPVTWVVAGLLVIALTSGVRAERNYDYTCAVMAPMHGGAVNGDEYYVVPYDNRAYEACLGRIPERWVGRWPLTDCSPGGRAHYSSGAPAPFPQRCRSNNLGNYWVGFP